MIAEKKKLEESKTKPTDKINLLDYFIVLLKYRRLVFKITVGTAVLTAAISLTMTNTYKAETRILPPQQNSGMASGMLSQITSAAGGLANMAGGLLGMTNPNDMYVGMIQGRTIADNIIKRFNLKERYASSIGKLIAGDVLIEDIRKALKENVVISADSKSNIITISVEEEEPKLAADMANAYVEEFINLTKDMTSTEAAQRKQMYEDQLKDTKAALTKAENELKAFQEKTGALAMDEQAKSILSGLADLSARIAAKEVEVRVMRSFSTKQNPDLQRVELELIGLKNELRKQEATKAPQVHNPFMPTGTMPEIGTDFVRKMRELKYNEALYELLVKQYELAKLDGANNATVIEVIDKAVTPEKKARPKRGMMTLIGMMVGFFMSVLVVFFKEFTLSDPETRSKFQTIRDLVHFRKKTA